MKYLKTLFISGILLLFLVDNLSAQWQPDLRLTFDDSYSHTSENNAWCIVGKGDTVHVVWQDYRDGNYEIYYKRSTDGGITWGIDTRLTDALFWSENPSIVTSGNIVHVVWFDNRVVNEEIYYKRSIDGGTSWGIDTLLSDFPNLSKSPSAAVSSNNVHVVWKDYRDGNEEIYYKRSTDEGITWQTDFRLTADSAWSLFPSVAVSSSNVHVVWMDTRDESFEVYYKRSTDEGISWEIDTRISDFPGSSGRPCIAASGQNVHVVWMDYRDGDSEIYYKRSTDGGITWGIDTRLTDAPADSRFPSVSVSGSNIHIVWQDKRDGNAEIYYKHSTDGGTTWGIDIELTNDSAASCWSSVAISGSSVHVVWYDYRDGNTEIYYKRNPTGNAVQEETENQRFEKRDLTLTIYPNPFTTSTTIILSLPSVEHRAESIDLKIYDVSGRLVKSVSLATNNLSLGTDLSPGIYFLKIDGKNVGNVVKVRK